MAFSRYRRSNVIDYGRQFGTSTSHEVIRAAIADGSLSYREITLHEAQRLDHIAAIEYKNGRYWWVIAAASNIGWGLQVPPGTHIRIPNLEQVSRLIG
jgi:hypothetical protein